MADRTPHHAAHVAAYYLNQTKPNQTKAEQKRGGGWFFGHLLDMWLLWDKYSGGKG